MQDAWTSSPSVAALFERAAARAKIALLYTEEAGYRLAGCDAFAAQLFNLEELPFRAPGEPWETLPATLAEYLSEALKCVTASPEQDAPPLVIASNEEGEEPTTKPFVVTLYFNAVPATDTAAAQYWYLYCFQDSRRWVRTAASLESRKLENIGELASGVAHDFNNLIMGIQANAEALLTSTSLRAADRNSVVNIIRACSTGASLTRSLLGYAKRQPLVITEFNLGDLVRDVTRIVGLSFGTNYQIVLSPDLVDGSTPVRVHGCYSSLSHCLLNLIKNAREAMAQGGQIQVAWEPQETLARLTVRDQGVGIAHDDLMRIFEPFYSTKKSGTGLGLAMVQGIMSQHQGTVQISSVQGEGTAVSLVWPMFAATTVKVTDVRRATRSLLADVPAPKPERRPHAFLVDDDDLVRGGVSSLLEHLGYRVSSFARGEEALTALRVDDLPKLLMVDYHMPGMDGSELIRQWSQLGPQYHDPETQVLLVSGHPPSQFQDFVAQYENMRLGVLQKPFSLDTLRKKLADIKSHKRSITMRLTPPTAVRRKPGVKTTGMTPMPPRKVVVVAPQKGAALRPRVVGTPTAVPSGS